MKTTTEDIIHYLPLGDELQQKMLKNWETMDRDTRFELEQALWEAYDTIYEINLEENIRLELLKAENGEAKLDEEFGKRMREKTELQMHQKQNIIQETNQLTEIRNKLEKLMQFENK